MLTKATNLSKQVYGYAALLALLNLVGLTGVIGYLFLTGSVDSAAVQRAVQALRGEMVVPQGGAAPTTAAGGQQEATTETQVDNSTAQAQMDVEILHREAERIKMELAQRLALNKSILVQVENERDAFRREQELQKRRQEETEKQVRDEGFEKQVEIFEALSPKVAVQHLLSMSNPEDAAKILVAIDSDRARKIVEAARRDPELSQMELILQKVRNVGPIAGVTPSEEEP